ncbi:dystonin isoform X35, partial [Brachionus plicatilis]
MLNEQHPAASHVKTYTDTLVEHFNWVNELSYLLSIHLNQLIDHENFKSEHKKLCDRVEELRSQLTDLISKSNHKNHEDSINKLDKMSMEIVSLNTKFDCWSNKSKTLTPFQLRRQKLNPPHNKCKFLVNYRRSQINLNKNEECTVEDNSQKIKWKIRKAGSDQSIFVPSVCLAIPPPDEESLDLIQQLKIRIESLDKQILSYRLQFKKDRLFNVMNKIKICDFDEYEERKKSADANTNFDLILNSVKYEIEELVNQSTELNGKNGKNQHFIEFSNSDAKLLIDSYDACSKKLNEFNEKSAEKNQ